MAKSKAPAQPAAENKKPSLKASVNFEAHEGNGFLQGKDETKHEREPIVKPAMIISKLNHPVTLAYNGAAMTHPPRGKRKIANMRLMGALPKGVFLVPLKK